MPQCTRRTAPARLGRALGRGALWILAIVGIGGIGVEGGARVSASDPPGAALLSDDFEVLTGWEAAPADGVEMSLAQGAGYRGRGLRLAFDFHGHGGYAIARKRAALDLPANYELTFRLRGEAPPENLEVKLLDPSGDNVWWSVRRDFAFPREWRRMTVKKRHLAFAWGPAGGGEIHRISALEIVVSAGSAGGGRGAIEIDDLELRPLPAEHPYARRPAVAASSAAPGFEAARALDGDPATGWHSLPPIRPAAGDPQWIALDFLESREYGGLVIDWDRDDFATRYEVETSDDGERWEGARAATRSRGGRAYVPLPESESRHVRLRLLASSRGRGYGIREIAVRPLEWASSPNDLFTNLAREAPRGAYPRAMSGEQAYWTLVGVDGGADQGLLDEDGRLEAGRRGFSVEPFVYTDGALTGWSDVTPSVALAGGYLPIPQVRWERAGLALETTAFASGPAKAPTLYARYRLANRGARPRRARLVLALRPFQVNPPWQFLGPPGGMAEIRRLRFDGRTVRIDGGPAARTVVSLTPPSAFGASVFDDGAITEPLGRGELPPSPAADDPSGWASGALAYDLALAPGASEEVDLAIPLGSNAAASAPPIPRDGKQAAAFVEAELARVAAGWHARIDLAGPAGLRLALPAAARPVADTLRTALAHVLISRDGPALRPGTRSYARSWIRDGALISEALLRLGASAEVRDFLAWYAPFQYADGKVPCCVDARGADPVPENDSHGELIYLMASYYRFTHDRELVGRLWEHAERAVAYIDTLRRQRRTPEYLAPDQRTF
ncbi:MAG TPA: discoidin domain-containing protein, partial [Thermoanaerobaculia bacterium]